MQIEHHAEFVKMSQDGHNSKALRGGDWQWAAQTVLGRPSEVRAAAGMSQAHCPQSHLDPACRRPLLSSDLNMDFSYRVMTTRLALHPHNLAFQVFERDSQHVGYYDHGRQG